MLEICECRSTDRGLRSSCSPACGTCRLQPPWTKPLDLPKPDLHVKRLVVPRIDFGSGESVPVVVEVGNQGAGGSYETSLEIEFFTKVGGLGHVSLEQIVVPVLASGADVSFSRLVTLPNDITRPTASLLIAKVDPDRRVTEVNDGNNSFGVHITVTAPPPSTRPDADDGGREDVSDDVEEIAEADGEDPCIEGIECTVRPWQCGGLPGFEVTGRITCVGGVEQCEVRMPDDYCSIAGGPCDLGHCEIPAESRCMQDEVGDSSLVCSVAESLARQCQGRPAGPSRTKVMVTSAVVSL